MVMICIIIDPRWGTWSHLMLLITFKRVPPCISNESSPKMMWKLWHRHSNHPSRIDMSCAAWRSADYVVFITKAKTSRSDAVGVRWLRRGDYLLGLRLIKQITEFYFRLSPSSRVHRSSQIESRKFSSQIINALALNFNVSRRGISRHPLVHRDNKRRLFEVRN